jgi:hypothetical protein
VKRPTHSALKLVSVSLVLIFVCACQRELNFPQHPAKGSLQENGSGECLPKSVAGTYIKGKNLADTNNIEVTVRVTETGSYTISSDTVNGYSFKASGNFVDTGLRVVKLIGMGQPITGGNDRFIIRFDGSNCLVEVNALDDGTDGSDGPADFLLHGDCSNVKVLGDYIVNSALTDSNRVVIQVQISKPGSYSINTSTTNGYSFAGSGNLTTAGVQSLVLTASGAPLSAGTDEFTISDGTSSCTFSVTVAAPVGVTNPDHFPLTYTSNWSYNDIFFDNDTITRTIIDSTEINGKLYKISEDVNKKGQKTQSFYRKEIYSYFENASVDKYTNSLSYAPEVRADILFLKENLAKGESWGSDEYTGAAAGGQSIMLQYIFNCVDNNASVSINGKAYSNVYIITMRPQIRSLDHAYDFTGEQRDLYYAKGVGLIYQRISLRGVTSSEEKVRNWVVH